MNRQDQLKRLLDQISDLRDRVTKLEDVVFNSGPPVSAKQFEAQLKRLEDELKALRAQSVTQAQAFNTKLDSAIRTLAELKDNQQGGRTMAGGGGH